MDENIELIKKTLEPVFRENGVKSAILFGSFAKGTATEKSDFDIWVDSGLRGFDFLWLVEQSRCALADTLFGDREVDMFDKRHINHGSRVENEIFSTGTVIYGDKDINQIKEEINNN